MRTEEHRLQCACVRWFRYQYPQYNKLLFAVPNGGARDAVTGAKLKEEGVVSGVADLILLVPSGHYNSLCIEMKTQAGRQSETQKEFAAAATLHGNRYEVCRSFDEFRTIIEDYLF